MASPVHPSRPFDPRLHPRVLFSRIKTLFSFFIWLLALAVFWMIHEEAKGISVFVGVVESVSADVAAVEDGLIRAIPVAPGSVVRAGDMVVQMDASGIEAETALLLGENTLATERIALQYREILHKAETEIRNLEREGEAARAEALVLQAEIERLQPLLDRHLADPGDMAAARARHSALQATAERIPEAIAIQREVMEWAKNASESRKDSNAEIQSATEKRLALTRLAAPMSGTVLDVYRQAGTAVPAGEPILRISDTSNKRVRALLPEYAANVLAVGDRVYVEPIGPGPQAIPVEVSALSPQVTEMVEPAKPAFSETTAPIPFRVVRGRLVWIDLPENNGLLPGQAVNIRTHPSVMERIREIWSSR